MDRESFYEAAYRGTKEFTQWDVPSSNATGFGAAADDYMERGIDLNEQLIYNKPATFFFRMNSDAMTGAGIYAGDILIVDRSINAVSGKIIVAAFNDDLVVRRLIKTLNGITLSAENNNYANIELGEFSDFKAWGVVTCVIHVLEAFLRPKKKSDDQSNSQLMFY